MKDTKSNEFVKRYHEWRQSGKVGQAGEEHVAALIDWLRTEGRSCLYDVRKGYQFDCEIGFDAMYLVPTIAFDVEQCAVNVFPYSDFISPNFVSVSGAVAEPLIEILNTLVKDYFGLR